MKRTLIAISALLVCSMAFAQEDHGRVVASDDSVDLDSIEDNIKDNIKERYRYGNEPHWKKGFSMDVAFPQTFGWSMLFGGDYCGYWDSFQNASGDFMQTELKHSFSYSIDVVRVNWTFNDNLRFYVGARYTSESFALKDKSVYLMNNQLTGDLTPIVNPEQNINSSKFGFRTWGVPIGVTAAAGKWTVSGNVAPEWTVRTSCKYSGEDVDFSHRNLAGFSQFRISLTMMAGFDGNGIFVRYSPTPVFEDEVGYDGATPLTFGLVLGI